VYEYYFTIMHDSLAFDRAYTGVCYKLDYKLNSSKKIIKFIQLLKNDGYKNPIILFYKQLNE